MQLQSIIFPEEAFEYKDMYFRGGELKNNKLALKAGESVSFDTYFNSFSYTKYRDYTTVCNVRMIFNFSGKAVIEICVYNGEEKVVSKTEAENGAEIETELSALSEKGFLYARITAVTDFELISGGYYSDCTVGEVNCCIAICTFKREQYVLKNIEILKKADFSFINKVFVIDNGRTLDSVALSNDFVSVIPNKNYGGSGGFTRGLIEAHDGGFSHVILMDDDVEFYPETLEQMTVFLSVLRDEYSQSWFSAGMFPLDKPWEQYELGSHWNGKTSIVHKHKLDMRNKDNLLDNLDNEGVEYGGWWTLCMPLSVAENGLPYPFFIKFDDVEYGMRKTTDSEVITMNGISVRHEAFDKKTSFVLDYYNLRNELVVNTIYEKYGVWGVIKRYWYEVCKQLFLYRYDNIPLVIRAVKDYLKGAEFFLQCNDEKLNTELIKASPKMLPLNEIAEWNEDMRCDNHIKNNNVSVSMTLTLGGHLVPSFALKKNVVAVPLSRIGAVDTFLRKTVIQYQLGGNTGIVTRRSFGKFIKYLFMSAGVLFQIIFRYKKCKSNLIANKDKITSMEFWKKRLEIK